MSIINKIKLNYNIKLLEDLISNQKNEDIISLLVKTKKNNPNIYFNLLVHLNKKYLNQSLGENLLKNKISLINSFQIEDCNFLVNFFKFYFSEISNKNFIGNFSDCVASELDSLKINHFPKKIEFDHMVEFSDFFFHSLLIENDDKNCFLSSSSAFFEGKDQKYFIYPNTTVAYFYIHKNPLEIYSTLKNKYSDTQQALNEMFNFENKLISNQNNIINHHVFENRQSWGVHAQSWLDPNVINTYRGLIINYDEFRNNPEEILTNVLFHLNQAGINVDVNYDLINDFVKNNVVSQEPVPDISNKEKKMLISNIDKHLLDNLEYQI